MAIDPKLLVIKPVDELTEVTGLQDGDLLFYDGSGNLKRISIETFNNLSKTAKPLKPTDATPTVAGLYMPTEIGTYANAGGLIAEDGFDTLFYFDGINWTKRALPYPQATKSIPQFADLQFPVTNPSVGDKVQCIDNFVPYQLLDGKTSTSTNTPSTSPTIWKSMGEVNIFNNTYTTNPSQLVPTELLYDDIDNTPALTTYKRISEEEGVDVNYLQTSTWYDGSIIDDSKLDGFIYKKIDGEYVVRQIDSKTILKVNTISDLRNFNGYYIGQEISLLGYYTSGDKQPLTYKFTHIQGVDDGGAVINSSKGSWIAQFNDFIDVRDFGIIGNSDFTEKINYVVDKYKSIYFPQGVYLSDNIIINKDETFIKTDGLSTVFNQKPQSQADSRFININANNVTVDSFSFGGNISTDISEQNHVVCITAIDKNLSNINIKGVSAKNVRGDVVYISARSPFTLSNVNAGYVVGDNILRNVVSITGGYDIHIKSIVGTRVGYMTFNIEPESYNSTAENISVDYINGNCIGFVAATANKFTDKIILNNVFLDTDNTGSTPVYASRSYDSIQLRNVKNVTIKNLTINKSERYLINTTYNAGELGGGNVVIDNLLFDNIAGFETNGSILTQTNLTILNLKGSTGLRLLNNALSVTVSNANITLLNNTSSLFRSIVKATLFNSSIIGAVGVVCHQTNNYHIQNCNVNTNYISAYSTGGVVIDSNITTVTGNFNNGNNSIKDSFVNANYKSFSVAQYDNTISTITDTNLNAVFPEAKIGEIVTLGQRNIAYFKKTSTTWFPLIPSASSTIRGTVNQSASVSNVSSADATDLATALTLVNELKSKLNSKFTADRNSNQQAT